MTPALVGLFVLLPLVAVPLGFGLVGSLGDPAADRLLAAVRRGAVPAAIVLSVAFLPPVGALAGALSLPWLTVTGLGALGAAIAFVRDPRPWRPSEAMVVRIALGFLAFGAANATSDRFGIQPFDFSSTIVLLTAVHFHAAGFVLPVAAVLAFRRWPSTGLAAAIIAIIVGIPVTAIGFFGVALAAWVGALLVAAGGLGVGIATIGAAGRMPSGAARWLGRIAGASLLLSMPLAAIYATGVWLGLPWLDLPTMARTHGASNVLGFALPAMLAWTVDRRHRPPDVQR